MHGPLAVPLGAVIVATALTAVHAQSASRSLWDGVYTPAQAARGSVLYAQHCALCHGPTLLGADGPPLTGVDFGGNWNGLTLGALADRIRTAMPPDNPGKLSAQERADVIAHILDVGRFPSGASELPRDGQSLAQIQFQASKP
jgi:mono/diheme cytochrome c family protein